MSTTRDWKAFNDAWRDSGFPRRFWGWVGRALRVLSYPLCHPHRTVKAIEPWGILFAVVGLFLSLLAFGLDFQDKVEGRTVRAWQLLTAEAPGNSGKTEALEHLSKRDGLWCDQDGCLITLKEASPLAGIDLSSDDGQAGAYLRGANLQGAYLQGANLQSAELHRADLEGAILSDADLRKASFFLADLSRADLRRADLEGAYLGGANLGQADLWLANLRDALFREVDLTGANLRQADLSAADLNVAKGLTQDQLDRACGDEATQLPTGLTMPLCAEVPWLKLLHGVLLD